jgi:uncharacterized protein YlxW (UPF0749 family)
MQTDLGLIIAIVGTGIGIIAVVLAMFFWVRSEANDDRRNMQDIQREDRKDLLQLTRNIENAVYAIQNEMKDFHNRLIEVQKKAG